MAGFDFDAMEQATKRYVRNNKINALVDELKSIFLRGNEVLDLLKASKGVVVIIKISECEIYLHETDLVYTLGEDEVKGMRDGNMHQIATVLNLFGIEPVKLRTAFEDGVQKIIDDAPDVDISEGYKEKEVKHPFAVDSDIPPAGTRFV